MLHFHVRNRNFRESSWFGDGLTEEMERHVTRFRSLPRSSLCGEPRPDAVEHRRDQRAMSVVKASHELPLDNPRELPRKELEFGNMLAEGVFGRVFKARYTGNRLGIPSIVTVKTLREKYKADEMLALVSEMATLKTIGRHPNIVSLLGMCTSSGPLCLVYEFAKNGNLCDFLRARRPLVLEQWTSWQTAGQEAIRIQTRLVSYAIQIAKGMEFLESERSSHGDLATRNVLVGEKYVLKIAIFRLAKGSLWKDYYKKEANGRLPAKWMAPEALFEKVHDTRSDLWSFGILLWELWNFGDSPYPSVTSTKQLRKLLRSKYRMEKPEHCPSEIYLLMKKCWNNDPYGRSSFREVSRFLQEIQTNLKRKDYSKLDALQFGRPSSSQSWPRSFNEYM